MKVDRGRSTSKQMVACFFNKTGHVATVPLEQRKTVNSEWYNTICLPEVFKEIRKRNKRRRIILHHDNASSHTQGQTSAFLNGQNIKLMGHPPISPDLAPNYFILFPHIKKKMCGQRFSSPEIAVDTLKNHVLEVSQSE
uniref:Mariner transposase [Bombyx mori] n=1 Tax=Lepeophtheirus salmonis TaxID=72036 RepID=A0A0K2VDK7_LEPSM